MLQNIEAVIFDLDGTLVDSMHIWREVDIEYLGRHGIKLPKDLQSIIEGMSFTETACYFKERFQLQDSVESIKNDWNEMTKYKYENEIPLKNGVKEFLSFCKKRGLKLGIASSNSIELISSILAAHNISQYFSIIKSACEVGKGKPAPDIYLRVAEELNIEPHKCLVFEDIIPGIMAGKSAGMAVCAIEDAYSVDQREEKIKLADYFIEDYFQIVSAI